MMDFLINNDELAILGGLSHIRQLTYLRGIRPYMDVNSGIAGIKRRISYQSIAEQLYVEPHQGAKCQSFSRDQIRRAVSGLVRAGIVAWDDIDWLKGLVRVSRAVVLKQEKGTKTKSVVGCDADEASGYRDDHQALWPVDTGSIDRGGVSASE